MTKGHIFICYSSLDVDSAMQLEAYLSARGIRTWRDKTNMIASLDWRRMIEEALLLSEGMILLWSKNAKASNEVQAEWEEILRLNRPLYIVLLDETHLNYRLKLVQHCGNFLDKNTLPRLLNLLHGNVISSNWMENMPFHTETEREFARCLSDLDIVWYYNPYPARAEASRFIISKFPGISQKFLRASAVAELGANGRLAENLVSRINPTLIAVRKHFPDQGQPPSLLFNFQMLYVDKEEWREIVQCKACENMQISKHIPFSPVDDLTISEFGMGIYEKWCPVCQVECIRCHRLLSKYEVNDTGEHRGMCDQCAKEYYGIEDM